MLSSPITEWLARYDHLERVYRARDHPVFDAAFLALTTFDHTLSARDRVAARVARWRRDCPADPLPDEKERAWWGHCLCRACAAARRAAALAPPGCLAPWQRQQRTLQKQQHPQTQKRKTAP